MRFPEQRFVSCLNSRVGFLPLFLGLCGRIKVGVLLRVSEPKETQRHIKDNAVWRLFLRTWKAIRRESTGESRSDRLNVKSDTSYILKLLVKFQKIGM